MPVAKSPLSVAIITERGEKTFKFPRETTVFEAVRLFVEEFGFPLTESYVLTRQKTGEQMDVNKRLMDYRIRDGEQLMLAAVGHSVPD